MFQLIAMIVSQMSLVILTKVTSIVGAKLSARKKVTALAFQHHFGPQLNTL